jgi:hypothetical protein
MQCLGGAIRFALVVTLLAPSGMAAQPAAHPVAARRPVSGQFMLTASRPDWVWGENPSLQHHLAVATDGRPMPAWLKWGIVGAGVGAITFAVLGRTPDKPNPILQDAAVGAVAGFVLIGGGVAFYNWVCSPGSGSRRAGLCGR